MQASSAEEWSTELTLAGTYDGPTDFVASRGYRLWWTINRGRLLERGMALLERSQGGLVACEWTSTITVDAKMAAQFPRSGQVARISITPFEVDGAAMKYEWHGEIAQQTPFPRQRRRNSRPTGR